MSEQPDAIAGDAGEAVAINVQIELIPIGQIHPNDLNPFDMQTDTFNELAEDMRRNGFKDPIDVRTRPEGGVEIIDGEKRWRCASLLGMTELPCIRHDMDDDDWRAIQTVRWNNIRGTVNPQLFLTMWTKLRAKYEPEKLRRLLVIEDKSALAKLVANASRNLPPALAKGMKQSAKEAKSIKDLSSILHRLFSDYGSDLKHSFMCFVWGGKLHTMVQMNNEMREMLDRVQEFCRASGSDMNDVLLAVLKTVPWKERIAEAGGSAPEPAETQKPGATASK